MADVKWIKIVTDIFDDEKMLLIESLPEADCIIVIWFKLLCLAGKQNNSGVFVMANGMPYTDQMLATIFRRKEATVKMALNVFEQFGMVEIVNDSYTIPNWGKHQDLDQLEKRKEYMRGYMRDYREQQKALTVGKANGKFNSKVNVNTPDKIREDKKEIRGDKKGDILPGDDASPAPKKTPDPVSSSPVIISILLNDGSEFPITQDDVTAWADLYQAVDIMQELRKMKGWADANPKKRKTKQGIKRFINSWLAKEQDKYHGPETNGRSEMRQNGQSGNVFLEMLNEGRSDQ